MIIDCISDLHGNFPELEGGDLLIVAGDLTSTHTMFEFCQFLHWFQKQEYKHKILVAGNHDTFLQNNNAKFNPLSCFHYLEDSGVEVDGLKIYGSPWTKTFPRMSRHCKAFTVDTEDELADKFKTIPHDVDILITHSPPYGILDQNTRGEHCGSKSLLVAVKRIKPVLVVCGHIHERGSLVRKVIL